MTKRLLSILVAVLMVMALIPLGAFAKGAEREHKVPGKSGNTVITEDTPIYSSNFEEDEDYEGWTSYDADGDGYGWEIDGYNSAIDGANCLTSRSYYSNTVLYPDNWLIAPLIQIPANNARVTFYAANYLSSYPDTIGVFVIVSDAEGESGTIEGAVQLENDITPPGSWTQYSFDLSAFAGQYVFIAIRHYNSVDQYRVLVDYFEVWDSAAEPVEPTEPPQPVEPVDGVVGFYFEDENSLNGWTLVDADGDGNNWMHSSAYGLASCAYEGTGFIFSQSFDNTYGVFYPDNWAITPAVEAENLDIVSFSMWACAQDASYPSEKFGIYVGNTNDIDDMIELGSFTMTASVNRDQGTWYNYTATIANVEGIEPGTLYFAIRHYDCSDFFYLDVDQVEITVGEGSSEPEPTEPEFEYIDVVEINGFVEPVWGAAPSYNVSVPEDACYSIDSVDWTWWDYETSSGEDMAEGDVFDDPDVVYFQTFYIEPDDGYLFSDNVTVLINGRSDLVQIKYILIYMALEVCTIDFTVEEPEPEPIAIHEVYINGFEDPVEGDLPADHLNLTIPADANYSFAESTPMDWFDEGTGMPVGLPFVAGNSYCEGAHIVANEGCYFAEDCVFYLDGSTDNFLAFTYVDEDDYFVFHTPVVCQAEPVVIDTIEINGFVAPSWGEHPFYNVSVPGDRGYEVTYTDWNWWSDDLEDGDIMNPTDVYDNEDYVYYQYFELTPAEGYVFADEVTVIINGSETIAENHGWSEDSGYYWIYTIDYTVEEPEPELIAIHEVKVNGWGAPVEGAAGIDNVFLETPDDAPYYIIYGGWRDETDQQQMWSDEHVFIAGHLYSEGCQIWCDEGYYFAEDCVFVTDDEGVELDYEWCYVDEYDDWICYMNIVPVECEAEEPELIAIHEVRVNGWGAPVEGVAGIDNVFLETPDDAPYFIIYGGWRDETDQQQMWSDEHVFIAGHFYSEGCQIWCDEGYYFAEDCVFVTDDEGVELDYEWCYVDEYDDWICYMNIVPVECEAEEPGHLWGDANGDGEVNSEDVLLTMRYAMGVSEDIADEDMPWVDVNGDGEVNMADALLIARKVMEIIELFPVEE